VVADGPQDSKVLVGVVASDDPGYDGKNPPDVDIRTTDNDSADIVIVPPAQTMTGESDGAPTVEFSVKLTSAPTAIVTIPLASSLPAEGIITDPLPTKLVFDDTNWNVLQTVTVKGVDDSDADGDIGYQLEIGPSESSDAKYDGIDPADLALTNQDDEPPK
jgi:large repetitive protein